MVRNNTDIEERKRAEEALRSSEGNLDAIVNTIPTAAWTTRPDGYCDFLNRVWLDYAGMTMEEAQGWGWAESIHPEDRKKLVEEWQSCLASGTPVDTEARIRRFDGSYRWFLIRGNPLKDEGGKILKWYGTCVDIEDRKRGEETLRARELSWRQVVDNIPGLVATTGALGEIEFLNRQTLEYFGKTTQELKDWALIGAVHPDDLPRVIEARKRSIEAGQIYEVEHRCRRADGVYRWFQVRGLPVRDTQNKVTAWYLLLTDIDDRKHAEEALRRSESYLTQAQQLAQAGSWAWQIPDMNPSHLSEQWYRIYGFDPKDRMPTWEHRLQRIHPDDRAKYQAAFNRAIAEKSGYDVEFRILHPQSEVKFIHSVGQPVLSPSGEVLQFVGVAMDVTASKRAEEALRRTENYRAEAQRLSHTGSWHWNVRSGEVSWSREYCDIFDFDFEKDKPSYPLFISRVHPEDRPKVEQILWADVREKRDFDGEYRLLLPDGSIKYLHSLGKCSVSRSGEVEYIGAVIDITERKRVEEAFRLIVVGTAATTGSDFFQSLVQHVAQALRARYAFVTACDDQKHARSLAFWKGDGFGEDFDFDIADTPCEKVLHGEVCHYREGLQGLFPLDKLLADWQAESYLGVPMLDRSNRVIGHIAILDDKPMEADLRAIDLLKIFASRAAAELKRQKAEDELQAALQERERMREELAHLAHLNRVSTMGELTASLAHEINQPIGAAVTNAQACLRFLNREQPDVPEACEAALEMVRDATRAVDIIDRVRSMYRKGSPHQEMVDINEVILEMVIMLRDESNRNSVKMHTELDETLPQVMADRVQLQQGLMNLMMNGIEAMRDSGGELSIKSQLDEDGQLRISISDTGVGLPTGKETEIFNAFFTTKSQGTGLGLAITRTIVESHGGRVWATNNTLRGTTFQFTLPSKRAAHA
jgi:PAS domain S-box-containing protein